MNSNKKNISRTVFIVIFLLAVLLRLYRLENVPPSPSLDEVSIGYNAYSLIKTGADEYGTKLPLLLRAYDDWRPALYVYLVAPFVAVKGLNAGSVRLPSVALSLLVVVLTYGIARLLFGKKTDIGIPEVAMLLVAVSPWHIYISRLGHEANLGLACSVLGIWAFLIAIYRKRYGFLFMSAGAFALALYGYQSQKAVVPVLLIGLAVLYFRRLWEMKKATAAAVVLGVILLLPLVRLSQSPEALIRYQKTTEFSSENPVYVQSLQRFEVARQRGDVVGQILYNRRIIQLTTFGTNYFKHFNPRWLFWGWPGEQFKATGVGLLYPWEFPLIALGVVYLVSRRLWKELALVLLVLATAPIPASVTMGAPHAMRSYTFLPAWQLLGAAGAVGVFHFFRGYRAKKAVGIGLILILAGSVAYFCRQYFIVFPTRESGAYQYALNQAIPELIQTGETGQRIIISNEKHLYQSYMFYLFHAKYDPADYQRAGGTRSGGYDKPHTIDTIQFRPIDWKKDMNQKDVLILGNSSDFPDGYGYQRVWSNVDGVAAVKLVRI